MSKALAHPTLFAATGLLFVVATFFNFVTASQSEGSAGTALVSPAHATPIRASVSETPAAEKNAVVATGKF